MSFLMVAITGCFVKRDNEQVVNANRDIEVRACESVLDLFKKTAEIEDNFADFDANINFYGDRDNFKYIYSTLGNLDFDGLLLVTSFRSNYSDQCLLRIGTYYIGSAPGAYLSDLIVKRDKDILPLLRRAQKEGLECDARVYKCRGDNYSSKLIARIEAQDEPNLVTDNAGDPFEYIPQDKLENALKEFLLKLDATHILEK
ncbi:MAG: hypothetical protein KAR06_06905 [Deltaproteobacteria bacterium]|nr:hypothetical protein [Deltaproteobacteria bacterium]